MCVPGLPTAWTAGSPGRAAADAPRPADAGLLSWRTPRSTRVSAQSAAACPLGTPAVRRIGHGEDLAGHSGHRGEDGQLCLDPWRSGRAVKHEWLGRWSCAAAGCRTFALDGWAAVRRRHHDPCGDPGGQHAGGSTLPPAPPLPGQLGAGCRVYLSAAVSPGGAGTRPSSFGVGWAIGRRRRPPARGRAGIGWCDRCGWCGRPGGAQRALGGGWHAAGCAGRGG